MGGPDEEERKIQVGRRPEYEAEEPSRHEGTQGHQPVHQRAMCDQGKAGIQGRACSRHEKVQGDGQLNIRVGSCSWAPAHVGSLWSVSPGPLSMTCLIHVL